MFGMQQFYDRMFFSAWYVESNTFCMLLPGVKHKNGKSDVTVGAFYELW